MTKTTMTKSGALALLLGLGGCVTTRTHKQALDAAYKAGKAEACAAEAQELLGVAGDAQREVRTLREQLRALCEKGSRFKLVNDVCVDLEGK